MTEPWRRRGLYLAARLPGARRPVLLGGAAGKLVYFAACLSLYLSGRATNALLGFGILDVMFASFFVYVAWLEQSERRGETSRVLSRA